MLTEETRKKNYKIQEIDPDSKFSSVILAKFINHIMQRGKKDVARKIVYSALDVIKDKDGSSDPLAVFEMAINNVSPDMEVRSKRVGGATYQVPMKVGRKRATSLAMRWIINSANAKKGKPMHKKLADEILSAKNEEGEAFKKKENVHKMAKANKAFAYLAR